MRLSGQIERLVRAGSAALLLGCAAPLLSACSSDEPQSFAPLNYDYLSKFHLNVGHIEFVNHAPPGSTPGDISGNAPIPPSQALDQAAHDRLIASGGSGSATFTITRASILHQPGGVLQGNMDARVQIAATSGQHAGYAEAHVSRTLNPGNRDAESRSVLYDLTSQMMQDMNVELEYQIKKNLSDWLVDASGAPLAGGVQQQDLNGDATLPTPQAAIPTTGASTPDVSLDAKPQIDTPQIETPQVNVPLPDTVPSTETQASPASSAPTAPDAIFPTGDGSDDSGAAAIREHSPQPKTLTLPGQTQ